MAVAWRKVERVTGDRRISRNLRETVLRSCVTRASTRDDGVNRKTTREGPRLRKQPGKKEIRERIREEWMNGEWRLE